MKFVCVLFYTNKWFGPLNNSGKELSTGSRNTVQPTATGEMTECADRTPRGFNGVNDKITGDVWDTEVVQRTRFLTNPSEREDMLSRCQNAHLCLQRTGRDATAQVFATETYTLPYIFHCVHIVMKILMPEGTKYQYAVSCPCRVLSQMCHRIIFNNTNKGKSVLHFVT